MESRFAPRFLAKSVCIVDRYRFIETSLSCLPTCAPLASSQQDAISAPFGTGCGAAELWSSDPLHRTYPAEATSPEAAPDWSLPVLGAWSDSAPGLAYPQAHASTDPRGPTQAGPGPVGWAPLPSRPLLPPYSILSLSPSPGSASIDSLLAGPHGQAGGAATPKSSHSTVTGYPTFYSSLESGLSTSRPSLAHDLLPSLYSHSVSPPSSAAPSFPPLLPAPVPPSSSPSAPPHHLLQATPSSSLHSANAEPDTFHDLAPADRHSTMPDPPGFVRPTREEAAAVQTRQK
ncbi:unnamed protein product [Protopolystoma xenopodis]|uniref:Uncharacterized protein n=1 Tax=Protopolystoma xenopodis TaxID=117903 RepID=A0A448XGG4_9PLAT|nr:unnamed protein product [Protopolystoma xenopodis]